MRACVHQGSVNSPLFFNFFIPNYPSNFQLQLAYADDSDEAEQSTNINVAAEALTTHAEAVGAWAEGRGLQISAPEFSVTLVTPDTRQSHNHPIVPLSRTPLPLELHPKLLSVTFDPHFTFHIHTRLLNA